MCFYDNEQHKDRTFAIGLKGFEPLTLRLSGVYSYQLSYKPAHNAAKRTSINGKFFDFQSNAVGSIPSVRT
jgi:hypothetical protein